MKGIIETPGFGEVHPLRFGDIGSGGIGDVPGSTVKEVAEINSPSFGEIPGVPSFGDIPEVPFILLGEIPTPAIGDINSPGFGRWRNGSRTLV